jgi:hypothetical protein
MNAVPVPRNAAKIQTLLEIGLGASPVAPTPYRKK